MSRAWRLYANYGEPRDENDTPPDTGELWSYTCPYCGLTPHVRADLVYRIDRPWPKIEMPEVSMSLVSVVSRCSNCGGVILALWGSGNRGMSRLVTEPRIFPLPQAVTTELGEDEQHVPSAILDDLVQTEQSFQAGALRGAALLLRSAVQGVCRDKAGKSGGLKAEMDALVPTYINQALRDVADGIRLLGNEVAHPDASNPYVVSAEDIRSCWSFAIELVRTVYVNPARVDALKKKLP